MRHVQWENGKLECLRTLVIPTSNTKYTVSYFVTKVNDIMVLDNLRWIDDQRHIQNRR